MDFTIHTVSGAGRACIVVSGEVDLGNAHLVRDEIVAALASNPDTVGLDLALVTFLDSTGLRALVAGHREARRAGCALTIVAASAIARLALEASGVAQIFAPEDAAPGSVASVAWKRAQARPRPRD